MRRSPYQTDPTAWYIKSLALVPFKDTPRFSLLAARHDAACDEGDVYLAVRCCLEWEWNVQYALMPPLYGRSILSCLEGTEPLHIGKL